MKKIAHNASVLVNDIVYTQEGACTTDTSVSTWNFTEYWNLSVISCSDHPWSFHSHPPRGKQRAYSVDNVFSGSALKINTTNVRREIMHV